MELLADRAPRWALRLALAFLETRDVARLLVAALEAQAGAFADWLRLRDAHHAALPTDQCLHVALAEGCWVAALALLVTLQRERSRFFAARSPPQFGALSGAEAFAKVRSLYKSLVHGVDEIPAEVLYQAAERGHFEAVQWFHTVCSYKPYDVLQRAGSARQLHCVQWLVDTLTQAQCVLRLGDSGRLGAVCWTFLDPVINKLYLCATTEQHGYLESFAYVGRSKSPEIEFPLADAFAENGDLASLEIIASLSSPQRFFTRDTIRKAATQGHLDVVQWLVAQPYRNWDLFGATVCAAKAGKLDVVKWLFQFPATHKLHVFDQCAQAGQLDVFRWIWDHVAPEEHPHGYPLCKAALTSQNQRTLQFIHEECGVIIDPMIRHFIGLNATRCGIEYAVNKLLPRGYVDNGAIANHVAMTGTLDAMIYITEELRYWSRHAFVHAARSPVDALEKMQFLIKAMSTCGHQPSQDVSRSLELNVPDLFGLVTSGRFDIAMWVLQNTPDSEQAFCFGDIQARKPRSHPASISHISEDLLSHTNPAVSTADMLAFLYEFVKKRPKTSILIKWFPQLAVRFNSSNCFKLLIDIGHPEINTKATCDTITKYSRDPYLMMLYLSADGGNEYPGDVAKWAAKYGLIGVLEVLLRRLTLGANDNRLLFIKDAASDHVDVNKWVLDTACPRLGIPAASNHEEA